MDYGKMTKNELIREIKSFKAKHKIDSVKGDVCGTMDRNTNRLTLAMKKKFYDQLDHSFLISHEFVIT